MPGSKRRLDKDEWQSAGLCVGGGIGSDGKVEVFLEIAGVGTYGLPPAAARQLSRDLAEAADKADVFNRQRGKAS